MRPHCVADGQSNGDRGRKPTEQATVTTTDTRILQSPELHQSSSKQLPPLNDLSTLLAQRRKSFGCDTCIIPPTAASSSATVGVSVMLEQEGAQGCKHAQCGNNSTSSTTNTLPFHTSVSVVSVDNAFTTMKPLSPASQRRHLGNRVVPSLHILLRKYRVMRFARAVAAEDAMTRRLQLPGIRPKTPITPSKAAGAGKGAQAAARVASTKSALSRGMQGRSVSCPIDAVGYSEWDDTDAYSTVSTLTATASVQYSVFDSRVSTVIPCVVDAPLSPSKDISFAIRRWSEASQSRPRHLRTCLSGSGYSTTQRKTTL